MDGLKGAFDSFRVEEAYNWRDDIMGITRRIVHETDEARLNNIAEHFEVDLSEIREFIEMKRLAKRKPITNADRIRLMSDEELAEMIKNPCDIGLHMPNEWCKKRDCGYQCSLDWLKQEVKE